MLKCEYCPPAKVFRGRRRKYPGGTLTVTICDACFAKAQRQARELRAGRAVAGPTALSDKFSL